MLMYSVQAMNCSSNYHSYPIKYFVNCVSIDGFCVSVCVCVCVCAKNMVRHAPVRIMPTY